VERREDEQVGPALKVRPDNSQTWNVWKVEQIETALKVRQKSPAPSVRTELCGLIPHVLRLAIIFGSFAAADIKNSTVNAKGSSEAVLNFFRCG
jgi:hypothetical protein